LAPEKRHSYLNTRHHIESAVMSFPQDAFCKFCRFGIVQECLYQNYTLNSTNAFWDCSLNSRQQKKFLLLGPKSLSSLPVFDVDVSVNRNSIAQKEMIGFLTLE